MAEHRRALVRFASSYCAETIGSTTEAGVPLHPIHDGPAGSPYVYGHVWVVLGLLVRHASWGITALPLLARVNLL